MVPKQVSQSVVVVSSAGCDDNKYASVSMVSCPRSFPQGFEYLYFHDFPLADEKLLNKIMKMKPRVK